MTGPAADVDVSVVIATRDRADLLASTLESLERSDYPGHRFRVVVADNGKDSATREVCRASAPDLNVEYIAAPVGGKNAALNRALERTSGELLLFTDDDVAVDEEWIPAMWEGARRWPDHDVFGGQVLPLWPDSPPDVVLETKYTGVAYSILDPDLEEGPHSDFLPFGPNFAVRRTVFDNGTQFDPRLGPRPGAYTMGGETELLERLRDQGQDPVFLPESRVRHRIRPDQYQYRWLLARARKYGRSIAHRSCGNVRSADGSPGGGVPRWMYWGVLEFGARALGNVILGRRAEALECAMDAAVELGKIDHMRPLSGGADHPGRPLEPHRSPDGSTPTLPSDEEAERDASSGRT